MRVALIREGLVENLIEVDDLEVFSKEKPVYCAQFDLVIVGEDVFADIGMHYENGEFLNPTE